MKGLNLCKLFAGILFSKSGIKIIKNYLFSKEKDFYYQSILIIDPPSKFGDWCEACPDMMYVNGKCFPHAWSTNTSLSKIDSSKRKKMFLIHKSHLHRANLLTFLAIILGLWGSVMIAYGNIHIGITFIIL